MVRTRVGYAGGTKKNPSYHDLGDHSETVQSDYDPSRISYEDLLTIFWKSHDPTRRPWSPQYRVAIFYHNEKQKRLALETRAREAVRLKRQVITEVVPFAGFYLAEDYHQKHRLKREYDFMEEFGAIYPDAQDFVNSTAAARVNGYLDGYGTVSALEAEISGLGLSESAARKLLEIVASSDRSSQACPL